MAREDEFMLTAEEQRLKAARRRRFAIIGIVLLLAAVVIAFAGRPGLNAIKAWQSRRHAEKAFALIEQEKWLDARKEAVAAYQLRPGELKAVRAVARFLTRTRQPDALDFWKQLAEKTKLTRQDRRDEANIALAVGDNERAAVAVRELTAEKAEAADWLIAAQLAIQNGVPDDARAALAKIDAQAGEREQFQAALLQLAASTNEEQVKNAWASVEKIAQGKSATALDALVLLARRALSDKAGSSQLSVNGSQDSTAGADNRQQTTGNPDASATLSQALSNHPLAKASHKLLALDLLEHAGSASREEVIARALEQFQGADAGALAVLAGWLNGKEQYQQTVDAIPLAKALQSRDLFLQHLDALGALGRWSEIKQLLDSDRFPLDPVVQKMYLARCNAQLGEKTSADNNWERALEAAGGDAGKLLTLADYATRNGNLAIAESAYAAAALESPKLRPAFQGRLRVAQMSGDTKKIHAVLADMLRVWPNDPAVQNDEAYMRLLLTAAGETTSVSSQNSTDTAERVPPTENPSTLNSQPSTFSEIEQLAAKLVQRNPRSMPHRTLLALARLKQNRPAESLEVYSNIQVAVNALTPSALAVHAAVLAGNGREEDAKSEAKQIKPEQLLPEERELIRDLM